jgi:hypothetical protein
MFLSGGDTDGTATNYKVDLATLEPTEIESSTAFNCIAAL